MHLLYHIIGQRTGIFRGTLQDYPTGCRHHRADERGEVGAEILPVRGDRALHDPLRVIAIIPLRVLSNRGRADII